MWSFPQTGLALRITLICLGWLVSSCANPIFSVGPGIWVVVDAEPELAAQLERIELTTDREGTTVWLKQPPAGERRGSIPVVHDLPWQEGRFRDALHIRGFSGETLLVERSVNLSYSATQRLLLSVFLTRACAELVGVCEQAGTTCIDCGTSCESDRVSAQALRSVPFNANPLTGYERPVCSPTELGQDPSASMPDGADGATQSEREGGLGTSEIDAGLMGAADAGPDARSSTAADARSSTQEASAQEAAVVDALVEASTVTDAAEASTKPDASSSTLLEGCALLLHMDEPSWSGASAEVRDESGLGHHGTAFGGAQTTPSARFGRAAQLDGTGFVRVLDAPALRPTSALTVSAWFYLDQAPTNWPGLVAKRIGYEMDSSFALFLSPDSRLYVDVDGEESRFWSNAVVSTGSWHHVAFTFDGATSSAERVRLYLDGALDRSAPEPSASIPPFTGDVLVGNLINGADLLIGRMDEVAIWMRVLTPAEISALASASSAISK